MALKFGFCNKERQLFGIPFKLCSIIELLINYPVYSIESAISHLELMDVLIASLQSMLVTILEVEKTFEEHSQYDGENIVRSSHPSMKCTHIESQPFETDYNSLPFPTRKQFEPSSWFDYFSFLFNHVVLVCIALFVLLCRLWLIFQEEYLKLICFTLLAPTLRQHLCINLQLTQTLILSLIYFAEEKQCATYLDVLV